MAVDGEQILKLASEYSTQVQSAMRHSIAADPEAQLTVPVSNLFKALSEVFGIGDMGLIREAHLDGVRPDFAVTLNGRPCGWVELKAPEHTLVGEKWRGREKDQWSLLAELDALIVSNGEEAYFYRTGSVISTATLPIGSPDKWDPSELQRMLELFVATKPTPIKRVSQLASRLAPLAKFMRLRLDEGLENKRREVLEAKEAWDQTVHMTTSSEQFSSDVAQVIAYSMAIAGLTGQADRDHDGIVTLLEAKDTLSIGNRNVLAAALGPVLGIPELIEYINPELEAIVRLISSMDTKAIRSAQDSRGEAWLWFYEDFLGKYDPEARKRSGVYYTPTSVVNCQVRIVDDILRRRFRQRLGFGSKSVVTLDPAAGSGTYPLAVIDRACDVAHDERGKAGVEQVARNLTKNLLAFEILPGPFAVAHLRIGERLVHNVNQIFQDNDIGVYLTDTLEDPHMPTRRGLFGDARILAEAAEKARKIKAEQKITVAIGNPPYDRGTAGMGGWVESGDSNNDPLFDDVINPAKENGVIFSAQASLYNLYVYFWRWAIWKAFQQAPEDQAVISFITASSWLDGPAFVGLRKLAVDTANDIWVIDLGGEGRGARKEENIFDIQSPVAIVTLVKSGKASKTADVYYRRVHGTREEKFAELDKIDRLHSDDEGWTLVSAPNGEKLAPEPAVHGWFNYVQLLDLFPWGQPGIKYNRLWPVAPSRNVLSRRWRELLADESASKRAEKFVTSKTGRNIFTKVSSLPKIADLPVDAEYQPLVRLGWRSFDRQWTFDDPRLAKTDSPALWQSLSPKQLFMVSPWSARISDGPAATVSTAVPDLHCYCNRGGKDVIPLYRDAECLQPNIASGLLEHLKDGLGREVSPEDLLAYCFALVAHDGYSQMFQEPLGSSPVRVPMTKSRELFDRAVVLGEELLWLQTYGERFVSDDRPVGVVPRIPGLSWEESVTALPESMKSISYDRASQELHIGTGLIKGVRPEVWDFNVSGMNVLSKWLGSRTRKGIGRAAGKAATPLDRIRPTEWEDEWNDELLDLLRVLTRTVELGEQQMELLEAIVESDLFTPDELPKPTDDQRKVPKTIEREYGQGTFSF
ncbi:type ISP restriction/modification enzyme [Brevibacterium sp. HMSC063G07]|uniref:type ISP restriction/modification enzyme n=1 Tax=Brevibacterium sp. HMSC063G07 TaxID=1739261 RepID=UPI0008A25A43|nr:type ISP restriction/modification enzyme [Brevibacterium sp. HMSC063G07]OFL67942.1 hypothetical protein HMPREF2757_09780 [Brevibacterium sp. HMSC063G07]